MQAMYRLAEYDFVIRLSDGAFIPNDPENTDRKAYNKWVEMGGVPDPIAEQD